MLTLLFICCEIEVVTDDKWWSDHTPQPETELWLAFSDTKKVAIRLLDFSTYMAKACCKPMMIATSHDNFSSLAKKGGAGWPFGLKGLYGMHRNLKS